MKNLPVIITALVCILFCSCSAFKHILPDQGNFFVTKADTCTRQFVRIELKQDAFGSVVRLRYQSAQDSIFTGRMFRRETNNTYSNEFYRVVLRSGQILQIEDYRQNKTIIVDYRCH